MSDIIVKFKPMGQEKLIAAIKKLETATGGYTKTTDKATKGSRQFSDQIGRNRAPMSIFENSLSTIRSRLLVFNFAMGMGIKQLMQFSQQASRVQDMSRAFTTLSGTGENSAIAVAKISSAVKGTMSQMDLFKQANNAMILGVTRNTDEMAEMFKMAQTLGAALGVDTAHAVESLITGIGRQSRLMLDNIGIIVKSDQAYVNYAEKLGITADKLTNAQKKQAFFTAAMEAARTKASELGDQQITARDQFNKFNATMEDFTNFIGEKSTPIVLNFLNNMAESLRKIMETNLETAVRQLKDMGATLEEMAELQDLISFEKALNSINNFAINAEDLLASTNVNMHDIELETLGVTETIIDGVRRQFIEISGFQNITTENVLKAIRKERDERKQLKTDMTAASQDANEAEQARIANEIDLNLTNTNILFKLLHLTKDRDNANRLLFDSQKLVSEEINFEGESVEVLNEQIGESIGLTTEMVEAQDLLTQSYAKSLDGRLAIMESQIEFARGLELEGLLNKDQLDGLDALIAAYEKLQKKKQENQDEDKKTHDLSIFVNKAQKNQTIELINGIAGLASAHKQGALVAARLQQSAALINTYEAVTLALPNKLKAAAALASGLAAVAQIESAIGKMSSVAGGGGGGTYGKFEQGGYVGGNRHSQGGTIIEAERGEFVMSRNAVESIGLETLNQMNQSGGGGSINVSVTGNVLTQDFVEGELAESIKEAVRRGSDFGIG